VRAPWVTVAAATLGVAVITSVAAHAGPPAFPDLSGYTPVNVDDYVIDLPNPGRGFLGQVFFLTPDGVPCGFTAGLAGCTSSHLPGIPNTGTIRYSFIGTDTGAQPAGSTPFVNNTIQGHQVKTLPPRHSITSQGVTCGVDGLGMTACADQQGRGFILSAAWSGWSAHITGPR
jgi:hypothetical protein